jgi:BirA family transcriptional regulator, biotin operon repressor / biotin---[acetyl-CoA-carboxylase] ligase
MAQFFDNVKFDIILAEEVESTNIEAKKILEKYIGHKCFKIISSDSQTAGRGREDRVWHSPKGNLYASITIPETGKLDTMSQITFVASLSIAKTLEEIFKSYNMQKKVELKWPNDVLVEGKKICGILLVATELKHIIVGVGVNIKSHPQIENYKTTSLASEGVIFIDKNNFLEKFTSEFLKNYKIWLSNGLTEIRKEWLARALNIGKQISVKTRFNNISGKFITMNEEGAIVIEVSNGENYILNTGEVFFE